MIYLHIAGWNNPTSIDVPITEFLSTGKVKAFKEKFVGIQTHFIVQAEPVNFTLITHGKETIETREALKVARKRSLPAHLTK